VKLPTTLSAGNNHGKKEKAVLDSGGCEKLKVDGSNENTRWADCQDTQTYRRRDPSKSLRRGIVARQPRLILEAVAAAKTVFFDAKAGQKRHAFDAIRFPNGKRALSRPTDREP
jgi:hypothetical protein